MTTTTYYNLNIVEGTDIVNPLTVDNPNYEKIDEVIHDSAVSGVTFASEIANATVHAITRENSECAVIRFIATSNWKAGDTATVDGVPVTVLLPSGEILPDGAYVINANVLCILTGTNLTVYAERKKTDNANEIAYNETTVASALTEIAYNETTVASALTELNSNLENRISFISNNVLVNDTTIAANTSGTYTATQDCALIAFLASKGGYASTISLNGIIIASCNSKDSTNFVTIGQTIYLKKGQTVDLNASKELSLTYKVVAL